MCALYGNQTTCEASGFKRAQRNYTSICKVRLLGEVHIDDNKFRPLGDWSTEKKIDMEMCDANVHLPTIRWANRFLKERIRFIRCNMPFKRLPKYFLIEVVNCTTILMNSQP